MRYPDLHADIASLAEIGRDPKGGNTRRAYSAADFEARYWLVDRLEAAGLSARIDAAGNVIGRLDANIERNVVGGGPRTLAVGSHIDTVPNGGTLDGALGVLAGLAVAQRLVVDGGQRHLAYEILAFCDEEGCFSPYVGSRAMLGTLDLTRVPRMRDAQGNTLADAMRSAGLTADRLGDAARRPEEFAAYLELHIEQGPILERECMQIGIVTGIVGQVRLSVKFHGRPDHAGTTPMNCRRDAFAAAASFATDLRRVVVESGGGAVMTIGIVEVQPGAGNVVPDFVRLGLEIRDIDGGRLARLAARAEREAAAAGACHDVRIEMRRIYEAAPVPLHENVRRIILEEAESLGFSRMELPSGAGHDAQIMAASVPSGMVFIPSKGGRSHCPEEETDWGDVENGVDVLYGAVLRLLNPPLIETDGST